METSIYIANHVRAHRKLNGIMQADLARMIGKSQAFVSKIEKGEAFPSVSTMLELAQALKISKNFFRSPYSEIKNARLRPNKVIKDFGAFKLPLRYARARGAYSKTLFPSVDYITKAFGQDYLDGYFKAIKVDSDILNFYNYPINSNILGDLLCRLVAEGKLNNFDRLAQAAGNKIFHGKTAKHYLACDTMPELMQCLTQNFHLYDIDRDYHLENCSDHKLILRIKDKEHLADIDLNANARRFTQQYTHAWIENFPKVLGYNFKETRLNRISNEEFIFTGEF